MAIIFSIIVSTRFQNDLHAFKINSLGILFYFSSIAESNIGMESCICFVF